LIRRLEETEDPPSASQLFKEIQARGYRGSKDCLRKTLKVVRMEIVLRKTRSEGYQGSIKTVQNFLRATHRAESLSRRMLKPSVTTPSPKGEGF